MDDTLPQRCESPEVGLDSSDVSPPVSLAASVALAASHSQVATQSGHFSYTVPSAGAFNNQKSSSGHAAMGKQSFAAFSFPDPERDQSDSNSEAAASSAANPVPSATTLSCGDVRAAQQYQCGLHHGAGSADDTETLLSGHNPMVTPATSDTASIAGGAHLYLDRYLTSGLPTVDEVPKAPPDYLLKQKGSQQPDRFAATSPEAASPHSDAASGDDVFDQRSEADGAARPVAVKDNGSDACHPGDSQAAGSVNDDTDKHAWPADDVVTPGDRSDKDAAVEASSIVRKSTWIPRYSDAVSEATEPVGNELNAGDEDDRTLEEYARRLAEAQGRTSELTDYLTELQERKDAVRFGHIVYSPLVHGCMSDLRAECIYSEDLLPDAYSGSMLTLQS